MDTTLDDLRSTMQDALGTLDRLDTPEGREAYLMRLTETLQFTRELAAEWHIALSTAEELALEARLFVEWTDGREQATNMIAALGKQNV